MFCSSINILGYFVGNGIIKLDPEKLRPFRTTSSSYKSKIFETCIRALLLICLLRKIGSFSKKIKLLKEAKSFPLNDSQISDF